MSTSILGPDVSPPFALLTHDLGRATAYLLIPLSLLYLSLYFSLREHKRLYVVLTLATVVGFAAALVLVPIRCPPGASLLIFAGRFGRSLFFILYFSLVRRLLVGA